MTHIGFDADQDCSRVATLAAARSVKFVCRYLKNLFAPEVAALHAAGLAIVLIWETTAERALAGATAGTVDGAKAATRAAALGAPQEVTIYATADFDVTPAQEDDVLAYFAAFDNAMPHDLGAGYSNGATCALLLDQEIVAHTWLAAGMGMRGSREFLASGRATIVQDVGDHQGLGLGISIDTDTAMCDEYGQWKPPEVT